MVLYYQLGLNHNNEIQTALGITFMGPRRHRQFGPAPTCRNPELSAPRGLPAGPEGVSNPAAAQGKGALVHLRHGSHGVACLVSSYLPSFLLPFQFTLGAGEKQIRTDPHSVLQTPPSRAPVNPGVSSSHSRHQAEGTTLGQPRPNRPDRIPPSPTYCRSSPRSGIKSAVIFDCVLTRAVSLACWEHRQRSPASVLGNRH